MPEEMKTRKQYMAREVTHEDYYGQFATESVCSAVRRSIGADRVKASTDPYFNDIPLKEWDALHPTILAMVGRLLGEANGTGGVSLSDTVCVAKAAARQIRQES